MKTKTVCLVVGALTLLIVGFALTFSWSHIFGLEQSSRDAAPNQTKRANRVAKATAQPALIEESPDPMVAEKKESAIESVFSKLIAKATSNFPQAAGSDAAIENDAQKRETIRKNKVARETADMVDQIVLRIVEQAKDSGDTSTKATETTQALFAMFEKEPEFNAKFATSIAERLRAELPGSNVAAVADGIVLTSNSRNSDVATFTQQLIDYALTYDQTSLPIKVILNEADTLANQQQGGDAIQLLQDAIGGLEKKRDVEAIRKHLKMTRQTLDLMSRFDTIPTATGNRKYKKSKKSLTPSNHEYAKLIGKPMNITGPTLKSGLADIGRMRGKWVVVHFWATWCKTSREVMPSMVSAHKSLAPKGVEFLGVNMDGDHDTLSEFLAQSKVAWPQIVDPTSGWDAPLVEAYSISSIPAMFLIDPNGNVAEAGLTPSSLRSALKHHTSK